jgi:uncharacterized membrane protein
MMTLKTFAPALSMSILLFQTSAHADLIKCVFSEPFVTTVYSMSQQTLTVDPTNGQIKVIKQVSFQIKSPGKFELVGPNGEVLQKLELNGRGSDGMSDKVYPYDVIDTSLSKISNNGMGGCTSNFQGATLSAESK